MSEFEPQIGHLLRRAYFRAQRDAAAALAPLNISPVQAAAIHALAAEPLSQAELGRRLEMDAPNVHTFVKRMIASDLAITQPNPSGGRRHLIALTPNGQNVFGQMRTTRTAAAETTLKDLSGPERAELVRLLSRIVGL